MTIKYDKTIQCYKKLGNIETHILILELMKRQDHNCKLSQEGYQPYTFSIELLDKDMEKLGNEIDFKNMMNEAIRIKQINKESKGDDE